MKREFVIVAIHGEGDRDKVNALQTHRNKVDAEQYLRAGASVPKKLDDVADELPDVVVVLRDMENNCRMEWPVLSWAEVEEWKKLAGYDATKRHWVLDKIVKVSVGG